MRGGSTEWKERWGRSHLQVIGFPLGWGWSSSLALSGDARCVREGISEERSRPSPTAAAVVVAPAPLRDHSVVGSCWDSSPSARWGWGSAGCRGPAGVSSAGPAAAHLSCLGQGVASVLRGGGWLWPSVSGCAGLVLLRGRCASCCLGVLVTRGQVLRSKGLGRALEAFSPSGMWLIPLSWGWSSPHAPVVVLAQCLERRLVLDA